MLRPAYRGTGRFVRSVFLWMILAVLLVVLLSYSQGHAAKPKQESFSSPEEAVRVMVDAMKTGSTGRLLEIFGPAGRDLFSSGDEATDRETREEFVKAYEERNRLEMIGNKKAILRGGKDDWPWPIPVHMAGGKWRFDTAEGKKEILARRIGENELAAIQVCLAYVDAQREYARDTSTRGIMQYADKFMSDPGTTNGLCWVDKDGGKQSPLGPLVANACKFTYEGVGRPDTTQPYHGYFYKILTKQAKNAPGGVYDYMVDGKMIGGFALVAYPAVYGSTGIMSFIVNQDSVVYQKDLGKNTHKIAEAMTAFDPDPSWKKVK